MHPMFQVTLYTGQQLVLEAMQRWLRRPCDEVEAHRQRRTKLKDLLLLLIKTAATGVLATILDAAIEYRRRQLLTAAAAEPGGGGAPVPTASRFPALGVLSRAGIAAWKARLLVCIDEMERRAGALGIEPSHRFEPAEDGSKSKAPQLGTGSAPLSRVASSAELSQEERAQMLSRTVEQLRNLVKQGDEESDRRLDDEVGTLIDTFILGPPPASALAAASTSVSTATEPLAPAATLSFGAQPTAAAALAPDNGCADNVDDEDVALGCCDAHTCQICMDKPLKVSLLDCKHGMCFLCARRLCSGQDHHLPQCPFCRQPIQGFASYTPAPP